MKGLIVKDFINLKKNAKIYAILAVIYGFMAYTSEQASFFSTVFTLLAAILTLTLYSYDEMAKWDIYALTMPVSRDNIVMGKYIMLLILTTIGIAIGSLFSALMYLTGTIETPKPAMISCLAGASVVVFFYCIIIPFITKMGIEKARIILFAIYIIPFFIAVMASKVIKANNAPFPKQLADILNILLQYAYTIVPLILLISLAISYTISVNIYRKKEF